MARVLFVLVSFIFFHERKFERVRYFFFSQTPRPCYWNPVNTLFSHDPLFRCAPDWQSGNHQVYTILWLFFGFLFPFGVIVYSSYKTMVYSSQVIFQITSNKLFLIFLSFFHLFYLSGMTLQIFTGIYSYFLK